MVDRDQPRPAGGQGKRGEQHAMLAANADPAPQLPQHQRREQRGGKRVRPEDDHGFHHILAGGQVDMKRVSQNFTNDW